MRTILVAALGLLTLGAGALQPAEAQPYYPGYGRHYGPPPGYVRPVPRGPYGWAPPPPVYRPYGYRPYGYRQAYYAGPRCWVRPQRVWNGWAWVDRPVQVCR
jgi:hypothetical protein